MPLGNLSSAHICTSLFLPRQKTCSFYSFFCCTRVSRQLMNETCRRREPEGGKKLTGGDEEKGSKTSSVRRAIGSPSFSEKGPLMLMHTSAVTSRLSSADAFYEVAPQFIYLYFTLFCCSCSRNSEFPRSPDSLEGEVWNRTFPLHSLCGWVREHRKSLEATHGRCSDECFVCI